ncbi:hypothetical protein D9M68_17650 [compost metagenome]
MVMDLIPVVNILEVKKGKWKEAHLILFEYCNLRCSFCHQDHESKIGIDTIQQKVDKLIANTDPRDAYVLNLTGGELFLDEFSDVLIEEYYEAGKRLLEHFDEALLVLGTNLIYHNVARVIKLVNRLKRYGRVQLATSYDPAGRFNAEQRALFFKNLVHVQDHVRTVNVVITKQNIQSFLDGHEGAEFKWMCEHFDVYFDHYIPSQMYEYIQPDEDLISQLYMHLNTHYPNSYPIKDWKNNVENTTTCRSTKIINKDNVVTTCWSEAGKDAILDEQEGLLAKDEAELRFLEKYDCFSCEFYSRCGMRCFLHHSFVDDGLNDECQIKVMFKAIL